MKPYFVIVALLVGACSNKSSDPETDVDLGTPHGDMADLPDVAVPADIGGTVVDMTDPAPDASDPPDLSAIDLGPPPDPLDGIGTAELVQENFQFTEGPRWFPAEGVLRFTDVQAQTIYELAPPNTVTPFNPNSQGANGLAFDGDGNVLACEHGGRRVSIYNGMVPSTFIGDFGGDRFNSPNDLVVRNDGIVYFTDPPYGLTGPREIDFNGLFRYVPTTGELTAEWEGAMSSRPNGVVLSPDQSVLYLADTQAGEVTQFDVAANGTLSGQRAFAAVSGPDGMAVDVFGNVYVAGGDGVAVFAPDGTTWGTIDIPRQPANCAFGGEDGRTLYVTARQGLYRVQMVVPGIY